MLGSPLPLGESTYFPSPSGRGQGEGLEGNWTETTASCCPRKALTRPSAGLSQGERRWGEGPFPSPKRAK